MFVGYFRPSPRITITATNEKQLGTTNTNKKNNINIDLRNFIDLIKRLCYLRQGCLKRIYVL